MKLSNAAERIAYRAPAVYLLNAEELEEVGYIVRQIARTDAAKHDFYNSACIDALLSDAIGKAISGTVSREPMMLSPEQYRELGIEYLQSFVFELQRGGRQ